MRIYQKGRYGKNLWGCLSCVFGVMTLASGLARAEIANLPEQVSAGVPSNIMFVIDDSGSMHFEVTPDGYTEPYYMFPRPSGIYGAGDYTNSVPSFRFTGGTASERLTARAYRTHKINTTYYNPAVEYTPWVRSDGSLYPNSNPTAARHHPVRGSGVRNLTVNNTQSARWATCTTLTETFSNCNFTNASRTFFPAVYTRYNGEGIGVEANYQVIYIVPSVGSYTGDGRDSFSRKDCTSSPANTPGDASPVTCTYDQEIQNFANWYTYYRSRLLASQAGIGRAFKDLRPSMRVGFGTINEGGRNVDGVWSNNAIVRGVREFNDSGRDSFYEELYERVYPPSGTPLRRALEAAGEYYRRSDDRGPWAGSPGEGDGTPHAECRGSYTILMTDGYWNGGSPSVVESDNVDGPVHTGPDGQVGRYEAEAPFRDSQNRTLADVAMRYWKEDLRLDLENRVPVTPPMERADGETWISARENPAFWQHMVTYGVAFGVTGNADPDEAFRAIETGSSVPWGDVSSDLGKIDDLLHAAVNSRGGFFNASDPNTFASRLAQVLSDIQARDGASTTSSSASSAVLTTDTDRFETSFDAGDKWTGEVISRNPSTGSENWRASERIEAAVTAGTRKLFTHNGTAAVSFGTMGVLSGTQQSALNRAIDGATDGLGASRLKWLSGEAGAHSSFRAPVFLGDIVNSNPQIDRKANFGHGGDYGAYRSSSLYRERPNVLYVGSNAGFLHAFDAETGQELFAYMPGELLRPEPGTSYAKVNRLMQPEYGAELRRFYVDGTPTLGDVQVGGAWRTVLIGSMGVGGRTVFALDVTEPDAFEASDVLWEFTHPDLGYGADRPQIVKLATGQWAAAVGNGKGNSNIGKLMFIDIATGSLIESLDAGDGGVSAPVFTMGEEGFVEYGYAGNVEGELWRFDVSKVNSSQWESVKIFQANANQPITSRPRIARHPDGGLIIAFGTGALFRSGERMETATQSLYGVFDDPESTAGPVLARSDLQVQTISADSSRSVEVIQDDGTSISRTYRVRSVSENEIAEGKRGWYLDLPTTERVISQPTFPAGTSRDRIRYTTLFPQEDVCEPGVGGFLMELNLLTGGRTTRPAFDLERDGDFHDIDVSVVELDRPGGTELPTIFKDILTEQILDDLGGPGLRAGDGFGRQAWEQLR